MVEIKALTASADAAVAKGMVCENDNMGKNFPSLYEKGYGKVTIFPMQKKKPHHFRQRVLVYFGGDLLSHFRSTNSR